MTLCGCVYYSYRTSLVRHSAPTLTVLVDSMVAQSCGSFYAITIASTAFKGIPVVKQHRLVNEALKKEIEGIHGLQVRWLPTVSFILLVDYIAITDRHV